MSEDYTEDKTQELNVDAIQEALKARGISVEDITSLDRKELILVVRGIVERFILHENISLILGRGAARTGSLEHHHFVDLTPHEAAERGVSRRHARIDIHDGQVYLTDLGSTNGSWLAGQKLIPHQPAMIRKGNEIMLGRLTMQVVFRSTDSGRLR